MAGRRKYADIEIRGAVYPSVAAAARGLRISEGLVYKALKSGTLDRVGCVSPRGGHRPMPIAIRGQTFANARAAAKHFGVGVAAIYQALHEGNVDRISRPRCDQPVNSRPITVCQRTWPSFAALSRALGRGETYVSIALRRGHRQAITEQVLALLMREAAEMANDARPAAAPDAGSQQGRGSTRAKGAGWATGKAA